MPSLKGRNAVVTGSTSGIGLAIAMELAAQGANILIDGVDSPVLLEATAENIRKATGAKVIWSAANMAKPEEIREMIAQAERELGAIDILVNNAGIQHVSPIEDFSEEKWNLILAVNLTSAFHTVKAVAASMKKNKWGRIINTASAHSLVASPYKSAYVTAKHGLAGFTKTIALELAEYGVTANCISPGYVWTPLVEKQIPDTMAARNMTKEQVINEVLLKAQPTKQFVTVEQVAAFATFLCSDAAAQITGANLTMDGGWTAQ